MSKLDAPLRMASADSLAEFVERHPRLFVLTGAGCSTDSGIPDYRDAAGEWKRRPPIMFQAFVADERARKRYWARSLVGFRRMRSARPNDAHTHSRPSSAAGASFNSLRRTSMGCIRRPAVKT